MLLTYPKFQAPDINGVNLSGGLVYFYEVGTATPKDTYTSEALTTINSNPVVLDARGEADIFLYGEYKIVLKDANDAEIWTIDDYGTSGYVELSTANRTYYVDSVSGSDGNSGLSAGSAFATIQKAAEVAATILPGNYEVTIQVAAGTYDQFRWEGFAHGGASDQKHLKVIGDVTTPSNCILSTTSQDAIYMGLGSKCEMSGFKVTTTTSGNGIFLHHPGTFLTIKDFEFGSCVDAHMAIGSGSALLIDGDIDVTGSATFHYYCDHAYIAAHPSYITTLTGVIVFSVAFAGSGHDATIHVPDHTYTVTGSVTGYRYIVNTNAVIEVGSGTTSYLPGTIAGIQASGGTYSYNNGDALHGFGDSIVYGELVQVPSTGDNIYLNSATTNESNIAWGVDGTATRVVNYNRSTGVWSFGKGTAKDTITTEFLNFDSSGNLTSGYGINTSATFRAGATSGGTYNGNVLLSGSSDQYPNMYFYSGSTVQGGFVHDANAGNTYFETLSEFQVRVRTTNEILARFEENSGTGQVRLYYNGTQKLATATSGIDIDNTGTNAALRLTSDESTATSWAAQIAFRADNSAASTVNYGRIFTRIEDPTSTSEDGSIYLQAATAGTLTTGVVIDGSNGNVVLNKSGSEVLKTVTGGIQINADSTFYLASVSSNPVLNFDSNDFLSYDRTNNNLSMTIGSNNKFAVTNDTTASTTSLYVWDADNASLTRVYMGANDSATTGFKLLMVAN